MLNDHCHRVSTQLQLINIIIIIIIIKNSKQCYMFRLLSLTILRLHKYFKTYTA
jgi:hypothetical protein